MTVTPLDYAARWEPRIHDLTVRGPGPGDMALFDGCPISVARAEITDDRDIVSFSLIGTAAEMDEVLRRLGADQ